MKDIYLHYNPGFQGCIKWYKNIHKSVYNMQAYGTVYIKSIPDLFTYTCLAFAEVKGSTVSMDYGFVKLSHEDRLVYNKAKGRELAQARCKYQDLLIQSVNVKNGVTTAYLQIPNTKFTFEVEYHNDTQKYFVSTGRSW